MSRFNPLDRDVQFLKGVGPNRSKLLARLKIHTARDLLYHTPRRYEDASTITPIGTLETGMEASVIGRVSSKGVLPTRKGLRIFQAILKDRTGYIECAWPGQPFLDRVIERGDLLLVSGPVRFYHGKQLQPREYTVLASRGDGTPRGEGVVFPIYPATDGLSHRQIRQLITDNLEELLAAAELDEILPEELRLEHALPRLPEALELLHRPPTLEGAERGRQRLAMEELFLLQLLHARSHHDSTRARQGIAFPRSGTLVRRFHEQLPFRLTSAQRRVLLEIGDDLGSGYRMNRLLQGDVGSGKTVVALFSALRVIEAGYQVALMAPTEILAEQHARTAESLLSGLDVRIDLLTGSVPAARRRQVLEAISSGTAQLVIGTHALIQETVTFSSLGLAIIDEQHRFGVRQRLALSERAHETTAEGAYPDVLVMSATPIPRSLALTLHGDLDLSILDERPPGRRLVRTALRSAEARQAVHDFIREQVRAGRQAYLVYPLVEESESLEILAATSEFERLRFEVFPELKLGLLHGQMAAEEKDRVMREFSAGTIDILVATTVIEVGIDVPNATVMVIEHAERFGLSQLHQLRGRVGRGAAESYCILISERPETTVRLRVFRATEDGFRIAEEDLRIRGQGDLFGERQAGLPAFRWARLERDLELLVSAQRFGRSLVEQDPRLERHPELMRALQNHFERPADLLGTG